MANPQPERPTLPRFASTQEVAEALGVSRQYIAEFIREGKLPAVQIGRRGNWRIPVEAIERLARGEDPFGDQPRG